MIPEFNARNRMDGLELLGSVPSGVAQLVVFDPQYRENLDKLNYGNEGARQQGRAALPQMDGKLIADMLAEIERVLVPSGHLLLWMDKFLLVSGRWHRWMPDPTPMREVDCVIWRKLGAPGMGKRTRYTWEACVVIQKAPIGVKENGHWPDRGMLDFDDTVEAHPERKRHPHAKPIPLIARLIAQTTKPKDLVIDPCAGGYGVLDACRAGGRTFLGADIAV